MAFLEKIQNLPERIRKIILWLIVTIIGVGLLIWWVNNFQKRLKSFKTEELKEQLQLPPLGEELKGIPKIEMPDYNPPATLPAEGGILREKLKELEKQFKPSE